MRDTQPSPPSEGAEATVRSGRARTMANRIERAASAAEIFDHDEQLPDVQHYVRVLLRQMRAVIEVLTPAQQAAVLKKVKGE